MRRLAGHGSCLVASFAIFLIVVASPASAQPTLRVNGVVAPDAITIPVGSTVFVGVAGGPGHPADWVGLYLGDGVDAPLVAWTYLNGSAQPPTSGLSDATIPWLLPAQPGSYHFRLFAGQGSILLAAGPVVTAEPSPATLAVNGVVPPESLSVAGGSSLSVVLSQGPGNAGDWVGLYPGGAADSGLLAWQYLNGSTARPPTGVHTATLTFQAPTTPGEYEFRLLTQASGRLATSAVVTTTASAAQVVVNGVAAPDHLTVSPGVTASVVVSGGPGNPTDWVALYRVGAPNTEYLAWKYLTNSSAPPQDGLTDATFSFLMPTEPGEYEC